jgi:hypothetical protein
VFAARITRRGPILLLLLGLLAFRVSLLDRGALAFPDEGRYLPVFDGLRMLLNGEPGAVRHLAVSSWGRPGFALVALGPALVQISLDGARGLDPLDPRSFRAMTGLNLACSLLSTLLFHRVVRTLFPEPRSLSLLLTAVYGLLAGSNLYIRHLLPYEAALALMMVSLERGVAFPGATGWARVGCAVASGAAAGLGFAVYPGFYPMPMIVGTAVFVVATARGVRIAAVWVTGFSLGLAGALFPFHSIRGYDYRGELRALSASIVQGDFDEGFLFVPLYLWRVEGVMGIVLITGAMTALGITAHERIRWLRKRAPDAPPDALAARALLAAAAAAMLYQMVNAYVLERMVWYGRLLHVYYPFLVIGVGLSLARLQSLSIRRWAIAGVAALQVFATLRFFVQYRGLAYPRDVLYAQRITIAKVPSTYQIRETPTRYGVVAPPFFRKDQTPYRSEGLVLVNFAYLYQSGPGVYALYDPPGSYREIYAAPHFLSFEPYLFEGFDAGWRKIMLTRPSRVRVLLKPASAHTT